MAWGFARVIVYGDVVLLVNAAVDAALLLAAGRLAGVAARPWRVTAAALLGAAYALGAYLWPGWWPYTGPGKVLASIAMVAAAFAPERPRRFLRLVGWLWVSAALVAGLALAFGTVAAGPLGALAGGPPWWALAGALGVLLLGAAWIWPWRSVRAVRTVELRVAFDGREARCRGLVDTGNRLRDPVTAAPVLVAEVGALGEVLPRELRDALGRGGDPEWGEVAALASASSAAGRLRVLRYGTVGTTAGLMLAMRMDGVECRDGSRRWHHPGALVGLTAGRLDPDGAFAALVPPEFVEGVPRSPVRKGLSA